MKASFLRGSAALANQKGCKIAQANSRETYLLHYTLKKWTLHQNRPERTGRFNLCLCGKTHKEQEALIRKIVTETGALYLDREVLDAAEVAVPRLAGIAGQ